jgi:branched-chain amino acid transport system permease protein
VNRLERLRTDLGLDSGLVLVVLVLLAIAPVLFSRYWISFILTQSLFLGIAAASLIFLSAYGGMVSLAQVSLYGIAGFTLGNVVTAGETKGLNLGWDPWLGVVFAIGVATAIGLLFGAIASRATGIYFLMITLTFSVLANVFFGQVTLLSGFGGISNIDSHAPGLVGDPDSDPNRLYYIALVLAVLVYLLIRYLGRTPFGLALQGVRDDPVRLRALGFNVALHRTLAFGLAAFVASIAGVLFVWWNGHIDPATIDLTAVLDLLIIAVIGGLYRLEGAWLGAFVFVVINNYIRDFGFLEKEFFNDLGLGNNRFHTYVGVIFLLIVLLSPGGLLGIAERLRAQVGRSRGRGRIGRRGPAVEKPGVP